MAQIDKDRNLIPKDIESRLKAFLCFVILLLCTSLSCGRDRNTCMGTQLTAKAGSIYTENNEYSTEEESVIWSQEIFGLLVPALLRNIHTQILERKGYITSYNHDTKCPNWVAWHLIKEHIDGPYSRKGVPYYSDDGTVFGIGRVTPETCRNGYFVDLEAEEPRQQLSDWARDYNMSHGHMCPAGDNKWDKAAMNQSFLLTNMCPQDAKLNSGGWNSLEERCRTWAKLYGDIYIVAGPIFNEPITRTIGAGKIAVPDAFFKVILCLEGIPKAIGFIYKNDSSSQLMKDCVCSVDDVEELSGFDFFHSLSDDVEDTIEATSSINLW